MMKILSKDFYFSIEIHKTMVVGPILAWCHIDASVSSNVMIWSVSLGNIVLLIEAWWHIYVSLERVIVGPGNGLLPVWHQAIL